MEVVKTRCVCLDHEICERKYMTIDSIFEYKTYVFEICRSLLSSRISKFSTDSNRYYTKSRDVEDAYCELIRDYIDEFRNIPLNSYVYNTSTSYDNLLNRSFHIMLSERPWITYHLTIQDFLDLSIDNDHFFYKHYNRIAPMLFDYFESSYERYKKYKVRFENLGRIVKKLKHSTGSNTDFLINEMLIELLDINSKLKIAERVKYQRI